MWAPRRRTSRGLRPFLIAAIVGAVLTYATAWGVALWVPYERTTRPSVLDESAAIGHFHHDAPGYHAHVVWSARGFGEHGWEFREWAHPGVSTFTAGWPAPALVSHVRPYHDGPSRVALGGADLPLGVLLARGVPTDRLPGAARAIPSRRLPIAPRWPGFVINTALFAAAYLGLAGAARSARRGLLGRPGRGRACGDDRAGLARPPFPGRGSDK